MYLEREERGGATQVNRDTDREMYTLLSDQDSDSCVEETTGELHQRGAIEDNHGDIMVSTCPPQRRQAADHSVVEISMDEDSMDASQDESTEPLSNRMMDQSCTGKTGRDTYQEELPSTRKAITDETRISTSDQIARLSQVELDLGGELMCNASKDEQCVDTVSTIEMIGTNTPESASDYVCIDIDQENPELVYRCVEQGNSSDKSFSEEDGYKTPQRTPTSNGSLRNGYKTRNGLSNSHRNQTQMPRRESSDVELREMTTLERIVLREGLVDRIGNSPTKATVSSMTRTRCSSLYGSMSECLLLVCVAMAIFNPLLFPLVIYYAVKTIKQWRELDDIRAQYYYQRVVTVSILGVMTTLALVLVCVITCPGCIGVCNLYTREVIMDMPHNNATDMDNIDSNSYYSTPDHVFQPPVTMDDSNSSSEVKFMQGGAFKGSNMKCYDGNCVTVYYCGNISKTTCTGI